jgi:hypothetical protein
MPEQPADRPDASLAEIRAMGALAQIAGNTSLPQAVQDAAADALGPRVDQHQDE